MDWKRAILGCTLALGLSLSACGPGASPEELPQAITEAKRALSASLGVDMDQIEVLSYEETEWPDACLGLSEPGEMCAQVVTPGYEVILESDGESYMVRTNLSGDRVRLEE